MKISINDGIKYDNARAYEGIFEDSGRVALMITIEKAQDIDLQEIIDEIEAGVESFSLYKDDGELVKKFTEYTLVDSKNITKQYSEEMGCTISIIAQKGLVE